MKIFRTVPSMQAYADKTRTQGHTLALVPTMGSLHEGHVSLIRRAKEEADHVTVTIFVNPTQFGPHEDFDSYPRSFDRDCAILADIGGVHAVFAPTESAFYPEGTDHHQVWVTCPEMTKFLCARNRSGHFEGVLTVVMKLFAACKPHIGVFGLKDIQQFILLKKMIHDLSLDIKMVGVPTAREASGLAYSSRNEYLSPDERLQARVLSKAVVLAAELIKNGETSSQTVRDLMKKTIQSAPLSRLQYAEIVDSNSLQPIEDLSSGMELIAAVAVYFGEVRLIDNALVSVPLD